MKKILIPILVLFLIIVIGWLVFRDTIVQKVFEPRRVVQEGREEETQKRPEKNIPGKGGEIPLVTTIAENLKIPWDIEFLPNGDLLVTERPGRLTRIDGEGKKHSVEIATVKHEGEGGLLGLALHPDFRENSFIYLYTTEDISGKGESDTINRVIRYTYKEDTLSEEMTLLENIPGAIYHDGGQLAFGPDNGLYITTGDARNPDLAQDTNSLAGKIIRFDDFPPFEEGEEIGSPTEIYSYGHRNPQGLAWDEQDRLWSTEHGRSGLTSGLDELNLIKKGGNYGWPDSQGDKIQSGTVGPILHSGSSVTWAPASLAYLDEKLYWGGLRGETLYTYDITMQTLNEYFSSEFGRIRAVVAGPDNMLYISTSNRDGRGSVQAGDDKILRINPSLLN